MKGEVCDRARVNRLRGCALDPGGNRAASREAGHGDGRDQRAERRTRQGLPTAMTPAGMSRVTTLPAPMVVSSPMVTPGQRIAPPPIHTLLPMVTGPASSAPVARVAGLVGW